MSNVFLGIVLVVLGALLGLVGTFYLMLVWSFVLDRPGEPGGALVFYLSLILSPLAGAVGGLLGAWLGRLAGFWAPDRP
jgi:hypothetical protein